MWGGGWRSAELRAAVSKAGLRGRKAAGGGGRAAGRRRDCRAWVEPSAAGGIERRPWATSKSPGPGRVDGSRRPEVLSKVRPSNVVGSCCGCWRGTSKLTWLN